MSTSRECPLIHHECTSNTDVSDNFDGPGILKWVDMEHEAGLDIDHVSSLDLTRCAPPATFQLCRLGSVNGLVLCGDLNYEIVYILNPVLNEYMALPRHEKAKVTLGYGFGVSSEDEYKVVRISCRALQVGISSFETEVYTLGTDCWKSLGLTPFNYSLTKLLWSASLYSNNHLYWLVVEDQIYDFDLTTETFVVVSLPHLHMDTKRILGVVKDRISCIAWSRSLGLEIWVMKEGSWYKEINIKENIMSFFRGGTCRPECVINGVKGSSNLLAYDHRNNQLVVYCLDTNTFRPLELRGYIHEMIRYRPTFLSLHNFGSARVHAMM